MSRFLLARMPLLFFILFALGSGSALAYQYFYAGPEKACEESGRWWAGKWRQCVSPISIEKLTGRPNSTTPAAVAASSESAAAPAEAPAAK